MEKKELLSLLAIDAEKSVGKIQKEKVPLHSLGLYKGDFEIIAMNEIINNKNFLQAKRNFYFAGLCSIKLFEEKEKNDDSIQDHDLFTWVMSFTSITIILSDDDEQYNTFFKYIGTQTYDKIPKKGEKFYWYNLVLGIKYIALNQIIQSQKYINLAQESISKNPPVKNSETRFWSRILLSIIQKDKILFRKSMDELLNYYKKIKNKSVDELICLSAMAFMILARRVGFIVEYEHELISKEFI